MENRVSFLLLCDGSCDVKVWKPDEDRSQWWSRRDGLVRMTTAAGFHVEEIILINSIQLLFVPNSSAKMNSGKSGEVSYKILTSST